MVDDRDIHNRKGRCRTHRGTKKEGRRAVLSKGCILNRAHEKAGTIPKKPKKYDDKEKEILQYLKKNEKMTRNELISEVSFSERTLDRRLKDLREENAIERVDSGRKSEYKII